MVSCDSDTQVRNQYVDSGKSSLDTVALINQFQALNDSLENTKDFSISNGSRGRKSFLQIVKADVRGAKFGGRIGRFIGGFFGPEGYAAGAIIGAVVVGGASSYIAYESKGASITPLDSALHAYAAASIDTIGNPRNHNRLKLPPDQSDNNYGEAHNEVLQHLLNRDFALVDIEEVLTPTELEIVKTKEFEDAYDQAMAGDFDCDGSNNDDSLDEIILNMYFEILEQYPEKADDVEFVSNKYIELINNSEEISEEDKELLYTAIDVAVSSYKFWESKF